MGNQFVKFFSGSPYSDVNCGFKAFKKSVLKDIVLYGNNFRFLPLWIYYKGYKVTEVKVYNRPRQYGESKFGMGKVIIGLLDTIIAVFLYRFSERPLHFFGTIGALILLPGLAIAAYLTFERIFFGILLYRRPALLYAVLFIIVGLQIVMTGILGELIVYLNKKNRQV
ncbi:hypothetical protein HYW87_00310 [Candidatus Roizmanbacteria bacterium]|nr:hypothetical protein [Candidatus Roizmanbacteria bacterium]